jgi:hypothetical protein
MMTLQLSQAGWFIDSPSVIINTLTRAPNWNGVRRNTGRRAPPSAQVGQEEQCHQKGAKQECFSYLQLVISNLSWIWAIPARELADRMNHHRRTEEAETGSSRPSSREAQRSGTPTVIARERGRAGAIGLGWLVL